MSACDVPDCGLNRCTGCGERLSCAGPEPARDTCATHEGECQSCNDQNRCRECARERREAAA